MLLPIESYKSKPIMSQGIRGMIMLIFIWKVSITWLSWIEISLEVAGCR